jgi:H/ACA ribonucleoprotein complex subunit 2
MGKTKTQAETGSDDESTPTNTQNLAPIAHPLAGKKLMKKILKTVKKGTDFNLSHISHFLLATKAKHVKRGVKEVVKGLRKGEKGYVLQSQSVRLILL